MGRSKHEHPEGTSPPPVNESMQAGDGDVLPADGSRRRPAPSPHGRRREQPDLPPDVQHYMLEDPRQTLGPDHRDSWRIFRIMAEFVDAFETMSRVPRAVSIFGSARTPVEHPDYRDAEATAARLARHGIATITGGGPGIMEAANKGAWEAGGVSVGLNIRLPHEQQANRFQTVSIDFNYFYVRKVCFVKYASGFICFPGGYGTLDEFFETLTLIQTLKVQPFPVVLVGRSYWQGLVDWLDNTLVPSGFVDPEDGRIYRLVDTPDEAVAQVMAGIDRPWYRPAGTVDPVRRDETGEGTRAGERVKPAENRAAPAPRPEQ